MVVQKVSDSMPDAMALYIDTLRTVGRLNAAMLGIWLAPWKAMLDPGPRRTREAVVSISTPDWRGHGQVIVAKFGR